MEKVIAFTNTLILSAFRELLDHLLDTKLVRLENGKLLWRFSIN